MSAKSSKYLFLLHYCIYIQAYPHIYGGCIVKLPGAENAHPHPLELKGDLIPMYCT